MGQLIQAGALVRAVDVRGRFLRIHHPVAGFGVAGESDAVTFHAIPIVDGVESRLRIEADGDRSEFLAAEEGGAFFGPGLLSIGHGHERCRRIRSVLAVVEIVAGPVAVRIVHPGFGVAARLVAGVGTTGVVGVEPAVAGRRTADAVEQGHGHVGVGTSAVSGGILVVDEPLALVGKGEDDVHAHHAAPGGDDVLVQGLVIAEGGLVGLVDLVRPVPIDGGRMRPREVVLLGSGRRSLELIIVRPGVGLRVRRGRDGLDADGVGRRRGEVLDGGTCRRRETLRHRVVQVVLQDVLVLAGAFHGAPVEGNRTVVRLVAGIPGHRQRSLLNFLFLAGDHGKEEGRERQRAEYSMDRFHVTQGLR